ncbi:2-phosphoxylose phosphatase 1 isoform X1 [Daphnia magna]|uniref:2-phosphoxylose phosphatase 1 n=1 Tax=Daphnia magna TaxID=35525 RepID=A0ABR0AJ69_9CRUS|nr:2-phosphoxylose phosphatase 1 isoform X1 [Daphnia magna]KAK4025133.1 hypothetical protein OUZ56_010634 [Daphnia magna]
MKKKCFIVMTFWTIFVVVLGVYWYLQHLHHDSHILLPSILARGSSSISEPAATVFFNSMKKYCNLPTPDSVFGFEGDFEESYDLLGVITIFRHGDRGPLTTLDDKRKINCSSYITERYKRLEKFVRTYKSETLAAKLLPRSDFCIPGVLSKQGASQLIELGNGFKESYAKHCNFSDSNIIKHLSANTTSYSRTIQSAYSFLFGLVGSMFLNINLQKSGDVTFCSKYCRCEAANRFEKLHKFELNDLFKSDVSLAHFSPQVRRILKNSEKSKKSILPTTLKDILLHYACHDEIPGCSADESLCVNSTTIIPLDYYLQREAEASSSGLNLKKAGILRAYGLLNTIDQQILSWINMSKKRKAQTFLYFPYFNVFSGHDLTLMYILASLGIYDGYLPQYASRLTFEVLSKRSQYYLRVLWNGFDVSQNICPSSQTYCNARFLATFIRFEMKRYFQTDDFMRACNL